MPGGGKSTVGREMARQLGCDFVDCDKEIERRSGSTIAALFARDGEAAFRDLEAATLAGLIEHGAAVIATGGGAVLRSDNRALLRDQTRCIYLSASRAFLWRRLRRDRRRPLLQVADPQRRLQEMSAEREPLYLETARIVVDIEGLAFDRLVDTILVRLASEAA
jgi:shikimate kinase